MSEVDELGRVWRVGWREGPLGFVPVARRSWSHRFDDLRRRFGTLYCALAPETAPREVLADLRPNAAAIARYIEIHGTAAAGDVPSVPVTTAWRQRHVLVPARHGASTERDTSDLRAADAGLPRRRPARRVPRRLPAGRR